MFLSDSFLIVCVIALLRCAESFRGLAGLKGNIFVGTSKMTRDLAEPNPHLDPPPERQSRINSAEQFSELYPTYKFNPQTKFDVPFGAGSDAIDELYTSLMPELSRMYRLTAESSSKIFFVSALIRHLLPVADLYYGGKDQDVRYDDVDDPYKDEHPETGLKVSPRRHSYFVMTDTGKTKLAVNYRHHSLVTDVWEFWEACAEGIRACEENKNNEKNKKNAISVETDSTCRSSDATTATVCAQTEPMYVALTNWYDWRFLKIENNEITASPILTPFPVCKEGVQFNEDLAAMLQYLCCAYGITAQTGEEVKQKMDEREEECNAKA